MQGTRVVFLERGRVEVEDFSVALVASHQALIRTEVSAISAGTELTTLLGGRGTERYPSYPGYSNVGVVEEIGPEVTACKPGDRVITLGQHASHFLVDVSSDRAAGQVYLEPVPAGVGAVEASFAILGSIAMHGVRKAEPQLMQSAVVIGQGVIGQLIAQLARLAGCSPVIGIDVFPLRLEKARQSGTRMVIDAVNMDVDAAVSAATHERGVDLGFDATRSPQTILTLMRIAAQSGKIIIVGSSPGKVAISVYDELQLKELTIVGAHQPKAPLVAHPYFAWTQGRNRLAFLDLLRDGLVRVDHLVTHRVAPHEAPRVYEMIREGGANWLGVVFTW